MALKIEGIRYAITATGVRENCDITIAERRIRSITPSADTPHGVSSHQTAIRHTPPTREVPSPHSTDKARRIDGRRFAAISGFKNGHTHAAMTLLRGYGDDMRLQEWLQQRIWPAEASLTDEDIYWGTRGATVEMIKSGTTFANDMYFRFPESWRGFSDSGMRAAVGLALFDFLDSGRRLEIQREVDSLLQTYTDGEGTRIFPTIAPHSIYTCSGELLQWAARRARELGLPFHIHMSETKTEVDECVANHGVTPWRYLESLGVLETVADRGVAAHGVWLTDDELALIRDAGWTLVHNPASNMKLASGAFDWKTVRDREIPVLLAPDGVASNNNLDMFDEMKIAALLQKHHYADPIRLDAHQTLTLACGGYSDAFTHWGVDGHLREGGPGDVVLIDLDHPQLTPVHNIESNLVYAANGTMVDTVIVDGEILMENRSLPDERQILERVQRQATELVARA